MEQLQKKALFNENGDIEVTKRRMINGNTTNLNDFNNMKYSWVSQWYRQAMNNFWIPEEINLSQDVKDYRSLKPAEKTAYDKILSFLVFLDSLQTANLPNVGQFVLVYSTVSGSRAFSKLFIYVRFYLFSTGTR